MDDTRTARPYLRTPVIAPDATQLAFVYAGDLWLAPIAGGDARRLTGHPALHFQPRFAPDGRSIVFGSNRAGSSDLHVLPLDGGEVRRLTFHETAALPECWSPDGAAIYFSGDREGLGTSIYRVAADGGTPIEWISQPYEQLGDLAISPDGAYLALAVVRERWWRRGPNPYGGADLWICDNAPGGPGARRIDPGAGLSRWPLWAPGGEGVYLVSDRGGAENIWYQPLGNEAAARQITDFTDGRLLWPSISADGSTIVFERDFAIWRCNPRTGEVAPLTIRVQPDQKFTPARTATYTRELSELALAPDGKKVAFVVHGEVFADFADKETDKELRQGPALRITNTAARESDVAWSHDSRKLLYISDRDQEPQVYAYEIASRSEARLTSGPAPKSSPLPSPDGRFLAYVDGDSAIRLIDLKSNEDRPFVTATLGYGVASLAWSPDSQWIVFAAEDRHLFENLYVQRIDATEPRQITFLSNLSSVLPIWAPNGQFIIYTTGQYRSEMQVARVDLRPPTPTLREVEFEKLFEVKEKEKDEARKPKEEPKEEAKADPKEAQSAEVQEPANPAPPEASREATEPPPAESQPAPTPAAPEPPAAKNGPKPVEIVFEGIDRRLRLLTPVQIDAYGLCISPDSRDMIFRASVMGKSNLWSMPLDEPRAEQPARQLTASNGGKGYAQFSPDGKLLYFLEGGQVIVRKFPGGEQTTPSYSAEVQIDFHQEKHQIFDECHRLLRDHFYDPTFRGLDWAAVKQQYQPLIAGAETHHDLHALLSLMMGELRASHLGISYPGSRADRDGYLGVSLDPQAQLDTGRLIVRGVLPEGPAALAGITSGVEILAVDGRRLGEGHSLDAALYRMAARRVRLTISGPGEQPEREVALKPIGADAHEELRYRAWVQQNEAIVHAASAGRLGYVHIPAMSYPAYQRFLVDLDTETYGKQGLVIDVRYNGGGHTASFFLDVLSRRTSLLSAFRGRPPTDSGHLAGNRVLNRPTVLVTNERSYSNAEMFAETYRRLGIGTIVGRPTGGAVIWTWRPTLLDGSQMGLPRMRVTTLDGEDLEGIGRAVDVDVALPLGDPGRGRDPQLEAAVRVLLGEKP